MEFQKPGPPVYEPMFGKKFLRVIIIKERARAKMNAFKFLKEVKAEGKKITWPTRKETIISTIAVFIVVIVIATFLYLSDQVISSAIKLLFSLFGINFGV